LKAAKTRIHNEVRRRKAFAAALDAKPVALTKADHRKLQKIFHPDPGAHTTKEKLTEAFIIFDRLNFKIVDGESAS
jgi:hypothetical protein